MASRKWPQYEVGREDYIFALGVLAANFNELEGVLGLHFSMNVRLPYEAMHFLFTRSDNAQRIKIIQGCLTDLPYDKREKEALAYFMRGYAICAENRNILLHAEVWPTKNRRGDRVIFYKDSKKQSDFPNRYEPSITALRAIADSTHAFAEYGSAVAWVVRDAHWMQIEMGLKNWRRPLPYRPPLPRLLVPKPSVDSSPPKGR